MIKDSLALRLAAQFCCDKKQLLSVLQRSMYNVYMACILHEPYVHVSKITTYFVQVANPAFGSSHGP